MRGGELVGGMVHHQIWEVLGCEVKEEAELGKGIRGNLRRVREGTLL